MIDPIDKLLAVYLKELDRYVQYLDLKDTHSAFSAQANSENYQPLQQSKFLLDIQVLTQKCKEMLIHNQLSKGNVHQILF